MPTRPLQALRTYVQVTVATNLFNLAGALTISPSDALRRVEHPLKKKGRTV
jgi:hypothetical protein